MNLLGSLIVFCIFSLTTGSLLPKDAPRSFSLFDKNGDGKSLGLQVEGDKPKGWIDELGVDSTGMIGFDQFVLIFEPKLEDDEDKEELRNMFRVWDKSQQETIRPDDYRNLLKSLAVGMNDDEDIDDMIPDADQDGRRTVNYYEDYEEY